MSLPVTARWVFGRVGVGKGEGCAVAESLDDGSGILHSLPGVVLCTERKRSGNMGRGKDPGKHIVKHCASLT